MERKNLLWMSTTIMLLVAMTVTGISRASPQTTICVDPFLLMTEVGTKFSVNITVASVLDLYAYGFTLKYEPYAMILVAISVTEGPFLNEDGTYDTSFAYKIDPFSGQIKVACTRLEEVPGASGDGTLATITFQCVAEGDSELILVDTVLLDSAWASIPHTTNNGYVINGYPKVEITPDPLPAAPASPPVIVQITGIPSNYACEVDVATVRIWYKGDSIPMVSGSCNGMTAHISYDAQDLRDLVDPLPITVTLTVTGEFLDGAEFWGSDTITVK